MTDKIKNIISNLIGLGVIALGTVKYLENDNVFNFVTLLSVGLACFLFKGSETKSWLRKFLGKKINKNCQEIDDLEYQEMTIIDSPDPDKEEK